MESWEKELQERNLQKAINTELGFHAPIEEFTKGKAHPLGTRRVWGGVEYEKKPEGWMPTGKKGESKKEEKEEKKSSETSFSETSPIIMIETSRATYTSSKPDETTIKDLKSGGWDITDEDFDRIKRGEKIALYANNRRIVLSRKSEEKKSEEKITLKENTPLVAKKSIRVFIDKSDLSKVPENRREDSSWKGSYYTIKPGERFSYKDSNNYDLSHFALNNGTSFKIETGNALNWITKNEVSLESEKKDKSRYGNYKNEHGEHNYQTGIGNLKSWKADDPESFKLAMKDGGFGDSLDDIEEYVAKYNNFNALHSRISQYKKQRRRDMNLD